jgi:hypothetical protein
VTLSDDSVGWIGSWSPGIGDPTVAGWTTVVLYVAAAWSCYRVAKTIGRRSGARDGRNREFWLWAIFSALLAALGLNKQLDMQTALTEIGRIMARQEGWYERRAIVQKDFIAILCASGATLAVLMLILLRRLGGFAKTAALGMCFIGLFVLVRASSFHKVDRFLGSRLVHLRMNWILEMGGIAVVLLAALGRLHVSKVPVQRPARSG